MKKKLFFIELLQKLVSELKEVIAYWLNCKIKPIGKKIDNMGLEVAHAKGDVVSLRKTVNGFSGSIRDLYELIKNIHPQINCGRGLDYDGTYYNVYLPHDTISVSEYQEIRPYSDSITDISLFNGGDAVIYTNGNSLFHLIIRYFGGGDISIPGVVWIDGEPVWAEGMTYEISILNNNAIWIKYES